MLAGGALLVVLMAITFLPFASLFTTALHPSGTYPKGLEWPSHPHWGNFVDAFHAANMGAIFKSSVLIVLGVVPVSVLIATMAGFAIGHLRVRGGQLVFVLFLLGLTLPFEGVIVAALLRDPRHGAPEHPVGDHPPADRAVHAVRRLLDARPLSEYARGALGGCADRRRVDMAALLARPRAACAARRRVAGDPAVVWTWNQFLLAIVLVDDPTKRTMAGALGAFQGQWGADIPLLSAGSLLILAPMIILFVLFQRHFVSALLQGSLKG